MSDEWVTMKVGKSSERAFNSFLNLITFIQSYIPQTETEKTFYTQLVDNMQ
jgi:hypothetical protein